MSQYNPKIHNRRSIRLKGYDYAQAGLYFITICCQNRISRFGDVVNGEMILNDLGQIANDEWIKLTDRFPNFELDAFQIMPDHMHGIIAIKQNVGNENLEKKTEVKQNDLVQDDESRKKIDAVGIGATARDCPDGGI